MNFLSFLSSSLIGVEIGPAGIKLVQLTRWPWGYRLEQALQHPLPAGVFLDGKIHHWDKIGLQLEEMVHRYGLIGLPAAIALPANLIRMERLALPAVLSAEAIKDEIEIHIQKEWPGGREALNIDFIYLEDKQHIFFAAVRQEYVVKYVACVNGAGLKTKIADIGVYALKRVFQTDRKASLSPCAILHVTKNFFSFAVFQQQEVIFHQSMESFQQKELLSQLKTRIKAYLAASGIVVERIGISAAADDAKWWARELTMLGYEVYYPAFFNTLKLASHLNPALMVEQAANYMIALGAAMREAPKW